MSAFGRVRHLALGPFKIPTNSSGGAIRWAATSMTARPPPGCAPLRRLFGHGRQSPSPAEQIAQRVGMHPRQPNQDPRVFQVMIGNIIGLRFGGHRLFSLLEGGAHHQRVSIFAQTRDQLAAELKCRGPIRRALLYVLKRQRHPAYVFEGHRHARCFLYPTPSTSRSSPCPLPPRASRLPPPAAWPARPWRGNPRPSPATRSSPRCAGFSTCAESACAGACPPLLLPPDIRSPTATAARP